MYSLTTIFNQYINLLWSYFQYDLLIFGNAWLYIPLMIPAVAYFFFFLFKWMVLLAPIWMPLSFAARGTSGILSAFFTPFIEKWEKKKDKELEILRALNEKIKPATVSKMRSYED